MVVAAERVAAFSFVRRPSHPAAIVLSIFVWTLVR